MIRICECFSNRKWQTNLTWWDHSDNLTTHLLALSPVTTIQICDQCFQEADQSHECCDDKGRLNGSNNENRKRDDDVSPPIAFLTCMWPISFTEIRRDGTNQLAASPIAPLRVQYLTKTNFCQYDRNSPTPHPHLRWGWWIWSTHGRPKNNKWKI